MDTANTPESTPKIVKPRLTAEQRKAARLDAAKALIREEAKNRRQQRAENEEKKIRMFGLAVAANADLFALVKPQLSTADQAWLAALEKTTK